MLKKILLVDNYDSFTWNLWYILSRELKCEVIFRRNNQIDITRIWDLKPDGIILSPGPGKPENSGICPAIIKEFQVDIPILGVCLGHQAIGMVLGASVKKSSHPFHGKTSCIHHDKKTIYNELPQNFQVMRYHSLELEKKNLPEMFEISSTTEDGVIMGIRHKTHPLEGVQFHPESVLTEHGITMLSNWLSV